MSNERSQVSDATREAEAEEAKAPHVADRPATPEEEKSVDGTSVDDEVRSHYEEMTELGANDPGEVASPEPS